MTRLVTFGETALRVTPPGRERLETATDVRLRADGTESNVAVAASRLGTDAVWVSKLPDTPLGKRVLSELHEHGLDTDVVWADDAGRQGLSFHEIARSPRQDVSLQDRGDTAAATAVPGELPMTLVTSADAVFLAGSTLALSPDAADTGEAILRASSGTRVFDLDFVSGLWSADEARATFEEVFDAVDVLIANEEDAKTIFERSGTPREISHSIAADGDFDQVVITRSEQGAIAVDDNVIHEVDALDTELVDPSGQHDAFVGGFLHKLLADTPTEAALQYGVAAAAITRTIPGPMTTMSRAEVDKLAAEVGDGGRGR
jgi:2-dehydro-3-deoxygluconokinase